jgi:DNA replication protein DnaC
LPIEHWHGWIGEATIADAILDRLLHHAHRVMLKGESLRRATKEPKPVPTKHPT